MEHDPYYATSKKYTVVGVFTDNKNATAPPYFTEKGIPTFCLDVDDFYAPFGVRPKKDPDFKIREEYCKQVYEMIKDLDFDLILFSGFDLLITKSLIDPYPKQIINEHPADVRPQENGKPKYAGLHDKPVQLAIDAGEKVLYSSVIFVEGTEADTGAIVCVYDEEGVTVDTQQFTTTQHREQLKPFGGKSIQKALHMICDEEIAIGVE